MSGLTSEERSWHHKCTCGIAAGLSLVVEHDTDCPFGQRLDAIIAARLADAEARAEAAEATVQRVTEVAMARPVCVGCFEEEHPCGDPVCDLDRAIRQALRGDS